MGKKNVLKLSTELTENTSVWIGISSHENDYRISWALNEYLGLHFVKDENYRSFHPKLNDFQEFSTFTYTDAADKSYRLIANRCENGFLLEELKNIDFFMVLDRLESTTEDITGLVKQIRAIPFVATAFIVETNNLKGKRRLA